MKLIGRAQNVFVLFISLTLIQELRNSRIQDHEIITSQVHRNTGIIDDRNTGSAARSECLSDLKNTFSFLSCVVRNQTRMLNL